MAMHCHHHAASHIDQNQGMVLVLMDKLVFWVDIAKLDSNVLEHLSSPGSRNLHQIQIIFWACKYGAK